MIFTTTIFIFFFLPVYLVFYYLLPFRYRSYWIVFASFFFYGWWRVDFLFLLFGVTLWTFFIGRAISPGGRSASPNGRITPGQASPAGSKACQSRARRLLILGAVLNFSALGYFKYFNFGVESFNMLLGALGGNSVTAWHVLLPVGISFYLFQATSYLADVYRNDAAPASRYIDLAAYIALFPQLIAGPILRYKDIAPQLKERRHDFGKFSAGALRFMLGFSKKVLVADAVAGIADMAFALGAPGFSDAWVGILAYTVQIYFDFSGYSDMAIGLGLMMGFRFMENFNRPYISRSITEFWRRWHISLSSWLRDYLYIPLGGNRKGPARTWVNLMVVMLLGGLWHGAAWTFAAWGAWHGVILAWERYAARGGQAARVSGTTAGGSLVPRIRTMGCVIAGWVLFRASDFQGALAFFRGMAGLNGGGFNPVLHWQIRLSGLFALAAGLVLIYAVPGQTVPGTVPGNRIKNRDLVLIPLFILSIIRLSAETYSPFLYFQF